MLILAALALLVACEREPAPTAPAAVEPAVEAAPEKRSFVPGERVGPITAATTRASLEKAFPGAKLEDVEAHIGEGFTVPATRVAAGSPEELTVVWEDASRGRVVEVRELGPAWRGPEGVGVGTSFAELEQALGPFQVYGFGWDYGGTVSLESTKLASHHGRLFLRLEPKQDDQSEHYPKVLGDGLFPSSDPNLRALEPKVAWVAVRIGPG